MFGSIGKKYATSSLTQDYIEKFWSLIDELLNAMLFLLIGLEFAVIDLRAPIVIAAALAVPLALFARVASIVLASLPLNLGAKDKLPATALLTWSGLRGGISVALALSLPASEYRSVLLTCCYGIVIFTMVVQGLTLRPLAQRLYPEADDSD
jgi:CPA1 family monovalent cation:H+ antiporter